jgi:hypothetical protein
MTWDEWHQHTAYVVSTRLSMTDWIDWKDMTDKEKKDNESAFVCGGYLKKYGYKEAWANLWKTLDKEEKDAIFADITGSTRELIPNYFNVLEVIKENKSVDKSLSMAFGMNFLLSDTADLVPVGVIGVDIKEFIDFYGDQYSIIEGRMLEEKETGILVGNISRRNVINGGDYWILPKGGKVVAENLSDLAKEYGDNLTTVDELVITVTTINHWKRYLMN